ncbi:hypothetical protein HUA74_19140 [Myxococcus sp. CA051A]|uniref:hypothetical protein n=1 Tax=unclassified Myxococcus TaxID=2648731 RepID=UPI000E334506|nr:MULTISPECIES: hypothetical protein [unclassified Myxococcus]AXM43071.1 hypothetical protein [Myxococcus sp.]NTX16490.1 hypothetical protein [Myxococcus sp. CA056]NTX38668.1 hypothetical protein [Myxococcus sp. CA033]NTX62764.1 hypothetical protein [Myxococcus sp. CA051A]
MKNPVLAAVGLCLWLVTPGTVLAAPRAFDFSSRGRSTRVTESRPFFGQRLMAEGNRLRALSVDGHTSSSDVIPTHVWLVPLILTGAGLAAGIAVCAAHDAGGEGCGTSLLTGIMLGLSLGAGYLRLVTGSDWDWEDDEAAATRTRLSLPLKLTPSLGVINDRAVLGLGGHF